MAETNTAETNTTETTQSNSEIIREKQNSWYNNLPDGYCMFKKDEHKVLYERVAFALFGPPEILNENETDATYSAKQQEKIEPIYQAILTNGSYDRLPGVIYMATIFVFGENLNSGGIFQVPVFRIRKCHKKVSEHERYKQLCDTKSYGLYIEEANRIKTNYCTIFIDDEARVYESWTHYLEYNNLPECKMHVPTDGKYQAEIIFVDEDTNQTEVKLDVKLSPACSYIRKATNVADIAGMVGGLGTMAIYGAAAIPAISLAPAVLGGAAVVASVTGVYGLCRSVAGLYDRTAHKQTVGLENAEARGHWLGVAGGIAAGTSVGATKVITNTVSTGATAGMGTRAFFNIATGASLLVNGSAVANSLYTFKLKHDNDESISNLELIQFTTSVLFFAHAAYNVRTANTFITETQTNVLNEYEANLSSNRKRNMFNKALLESERIKGPEVGRAEMIRGLRTITNHDEFFGTLVRNNKLFNENNARFTVGPDGRIQVNTNMFIDSSEFASMSVTSRQNFFANLPENPVTRPNVVRTTNPQMNTSMSIPYRDELLQLGVSVSQFAVRDPSVQAILDEILNYFEVDIREKLKYILKYVSKEVDDLTKRIELIFRHTDKIIVILQFFFQYLEDYLREYGSDPNENININNDNANDLLRFMCDDPNKLNKIIFVIRNVNETFIDEIIAEFRKWIQNGVETYLKKYEEMRRESSQSIQNECPLCKGVYYSVL